MKNNLKTTSTILAKFQTTIPTGVRDQFDLREGDLLEWQFDSGTGTLVVRPMRANLIPPKGAQAIRRAWQAHTMGETRPVSPSTLENSKLGRQTEKEEVME
jgi:AbrB family looped-hinge helix DNA binding protein